MTTKPNEYLEEPARRTAVYREADVCVIGGGAAGVAAGVAAARSGARVVLLERAGFLGGTLTTVSLGSICGLYAVDPARLVQVVGGLCGEIIERLRAIGGAHEPVRWLQTASLPYDLFSMKLVLDELLEQAGVEVLLHSQVVDVQHAHGRVHAVMFESKQGRMAVRAGQFIDCSGDADVVARAGGPFEIALEDLQFPTAMARFGDVDTDALQALTRPELRQCLERAVEDGMDLPRTAGGVFSERPGLAHLNITKVAVDGRSPSPLDVAAMSRAERAGRRQVRDYLQAFRRYVPGFARAYVLDTGSVLGVRESRRIVGRHVLTGEQVLGAARFDDAIACCAWPMEDHAAGRATQWIWLEPGAYFQIPLRSLLMAQFDNLSVAGRCASATHAAQASLRVTAQCFAMGEAAGIAAALALQAGASLHDVDAQSVRRQLAARGAFLGDTPA
ncbi:FAD-dependent oxidoreductase [Orrella sp. JC864]|uniref:FAD-dependent oxidoreductase n=1 Tax=Orrella sp. JC864 TaxID=3120298 RepID=UPI00300A522F